MNSQLTVTFLGTGTSQGVPVIGSDHPVCKSTDPKDKRLRVSVLLQWDNYNYVIDCGPDFRYQMLREGVTQSQWYIINARTQRSYCWNR